MQIYDPHIAARSGVRAGVSTCCLLKFTQSPNKECPKGLNLDVSSQKPELSSDFFLTSLSAGTKLEAWSHLGSFLKWAV